MTTARRFARFNAVSAAGFVVQLTTVAALSEWLAVPDVGATAAGVGAAVVHNFLWHWRWTWEDRALSRSGATVAFVRFAAGNGLVSFVGNIVIVAALVETTAIGVLVANVIAVGVCGVLNYQIGDRMVFRPNPRASVQ